MRVLALDASTKTGWALFVDGKLTDSGALAPVKVTNFNVNDHDTQKKPEYPFNIVDAAETVANQVVELVNRVFHPMPPATSPDRLIVIENTNKGRNRHTQRLLEFIHMELLKRFRHRVSVLYMDTSEWRSIVQLWMNKDDLKNNRDVKAGKKRGKITKKHLAVRTVNARYGKQLKQKDNDEADAILMGQAYHTRSQT